MKKIQKKVQKNGFLNRAPAVHFILREMPACFLALKTSYSICCRAKLFRASRLLFFKKPFFLLLKYEKEWEARRISNGRIHTGRRGPMRNRSVTGPAFFPIHDFCSNTETAQNESSVDEAKLACLEQFGKILFEVWKSGLGLLLALVLMVPQGFSAGLEIQNLTVPADSPSFTIPIRLEPQSGEAVSCLGFEVTYDPDILIYDSASIGAQGTDAAKEVRSVLRSSGRIRLLILGQNQNVITTGELVQLHFHLHSNIQHSITTLHIESTSITDPSGDQSYASQVTDGTLTVNRVQTETIYIFLNGKRIASEDEDGKLFYHDDHLGSPVVITDNSGEEVRYIEYYPFGDTKLERWGNSPFANKPVKHKYNSKELDESTGLYDYGARQYDAILQRFVSADPLDWKKEIASNNNISANEVSQKTDIGFLGNPQNLNRYSYARNNPLVFKDSSGLKVERAQYEVYVKIHGIMIPTGKYHNYWILTPDNPIDFEGDTRFTRNANGKLQTTITGKPEREKLGDYGILQSIPNGDRYEKPIYRTEVSPTDGKTDTQFIKELTGIDQSYQNNLSYDPLPDNKNEKYNSNSYFSGIGKEAGIQNMPSLPADSKSPGLNKPAPIKPKRMPVKRGR